MTATLTLLEDVRWRGAPVAGERSQALLAALASTGGRPVRAERLIDLVWGGEAPADAAKGLQVLVSRTRRACGADAIVHDGGGYRLGVAPTEVDSGRLAATVDEARAALDHDAAAAAALAREALATADGLRPPAAGDAGPLTDLRRAAAADLQAARTILARAWSRTGAHADALPALEAAHAEHPDDESLLAELLRSEAAVRGPGAALERFERYRQELLEQLGTSPGERLRRAHRDLLALDRPVRSGVRYDATPLLGRDRDAERLRALLAGSRVVSIVGPGGLGKTRLAHVLARDATQPLVHVVELVGVTAPEDVVGEVGSVLGVRDSISGRRTLTPEQRADVRARIAQRLQQAPGLLVLDNCEHVIEAAAELVAFLISTTADLRVLTTSRAPLAIAAERVYLLGELDVADAVELFRQRASAARPGAQLDDRVVASIVTRLDGLPLAIELAAAKVRAMAVEEIDRRLEDRFALLRGGDRSAPDRHQTLLAVIDWSWNLLDADERRSLRRLALFHDGFTLEAADAVLGAGALDTVQGLVDQSLLSVGEAADGVRFRMLETVREFGRMKLAATGEEAEARTTLRGWAIAYARRHGDRLASTEQFAAIDAICAEEVNLADELRDAMSEGDIDALVLLLGPLGMFWAIRGDHGRLIVLVKGIADAIAGWSPRPELEDATRAALAVTLGNAMITGDESSGPLRDLLRRLGPGPGDTRLAGLVRVMLAYDPSDPAAFVDTIERLADDPDRGVALTAHQWLGHTRENSGDPTGAIAACERALALVRDDDGPWSAAILSTQLAQLSMALGDHRGGTPHALAALPVMRRLGARDDEVQLRMLLVMCAIAQGRIDDAQTELERIDEADDAHRLFGAGAAREMARAELAVARGDHAAGLQAYRDCAAAMHELRFPGVDPTGLEPWTLVGDAVALVAHAHHATGADVDAGQALFRLCHELGARTLDPALPDLDYPVAGMLALALGTWGLLRDAAPVDVALRLLALADRFAYNRTVPTMAWERIAPHAEERAPGELAALRAHYAGRPAPELVDEARGLVDQLPG